MRSVILLRSRPGRPWWQLTTRPSTAVVLGVVSFVAAGVQLALLSSPTPWYQAAVAGFWTAVGLAFLGSAVGTRTRARRAAEARRRVPVDSLPFVPVPVRPARPRRRDAVRADDSGGDKESRRGERSRHDQVEVDTGEPTADLADAVRTAVTPIVAVAPPAAAEPPVSGSREHSRPRPAESPERLLDRHAVRAVRSVQTASRELPVVSSGLTGETLGIRDGRVGPRPDTTVGPRPDATLGPRHEIGLGPRPDATLGPRHEIGLGARHDAREPAAPDGAVPSPRRAPEGTGPHRTDRHRHVRPSAHRLPATPTGGPITGDARWTSGGMSFGGGGRGTGLPAPTDTGRHAMVEPRELPRPRDTGTLPPRPARHAAPPRDRVR